jgi:hypothetical protein
MKQHLSQAAGKFKKYRFSLCDYRGLTKIEVSTPSIQLIANLCRSAAAVNPDAVVALVAESDLSYGLSRMWEMLCEDIAWETCVFKRYEEAEAWIRERVEERWNIVDLTIS